MLKSFSTHQSPGCTEYLLYYIQRKLSIGKGTCRLLHWWIKCSTWVRLFGSISRLWHGTQTGRGNQSGLEKILEDAEWDDPAEDSLKITMQASGTDLGQNAPLTDLGGLWKLEIKHLHSLQGTAGPVQSRSEPQWSSIAFGEAARKPKVCQVQWAGTRRSFEPIAKVEAQNVPLEKKCGES